MMHENAQKISIAKNAQVGSEERNICDNVIHESAATKIVCQQNITSDILSELS